MKKIKYIFMSMIAVTVIAIVGIIILDGQQLDCSNDVVALNRITIEASKNLEHLEDMNVQPDIGAFAIYDIDGDMIYSHGYNAKTMVEAIKYASAMQNIIVDHTLLGTVVLAPTYEKTIYNYRTKISIILCCVLIVMWGMAITFAYYINRLIIRPFEEMKEFAKEIAIGNLEMDLKMDKKNIFGIFTESFDIMRTELKNAREKAEKTEKSKMELIASISHDIKTPITSILVVCEFLSVIIKDEDQLAKIVSISSKAEQINLMTADLLNSQLEELGELKVTMASVLSSDISTMFIVADTQNKILNCKLEHCIVKADKVRMQQVINNIIDNSYKYADTSIWVESKIVGDRLLIRIKDMGNGVPEEEIHKIKEKYYRAKGTENKHGSGLGLYIVHDLMNKMEGSVTFRNVEDGFIVKLELELA
ncbi:His Kinase A (phospho-acceptor) domain-containing protein [Anaerosporobacter mobilis DSM 15930]|jgi:signal transduction histidine kinase|uniref:histidine kinase n=1 Tax=Anaerosporobacter mobilis DSM 15930 TaxID=1120996 RepID=A0A1M7I969_9FIRM|nr:HAMP domain-containing sensor histidine kinase [Anaerosporobacter mobilis]SHM37312.1 His Kinase A (phospho-acceptor) domain-containing protein [Anaerosporobacter mobilis DSM 15930]